MSCKVERNMSVWICMTLVSFLITLASSSSSIRNDKVKLIPTAKGAIKQTKYMFTKEWEWPINNIKDVRTIMSKYDCVVPVIGKNVSSSMAAKYSGGIYNGRNTTFIQKRAELFDMGFYPGVEYRLLNIVNITRSNGGKDASKGINRFNQLLSIFNNDAFTNTNDSNDRNIIIDQILTVRPAYKLIPELERQWPVEVLSSSIPYILTKGMYNTITVIGSASLALSFFLTAFLLSNIFTLSVINSRSMMPTILPKDIVVVEKVTPFIKRLLHVQPLVNKNDIIFFSAPDEFNKFIKDNNNAYNNQAMVKSIKYKEIKRSNLDDISLISSSSITIPTTTTTATTSNTNNNDISNQLPISPVAIPTSPVAVDLPGDGTKKNSLNFNSYLKPVEKSSLLVKRVHSLSKNSIGMKPRSSSSSSSNSDSDSNDNNVCIDVRGDNPAVSLDSRQWGCLNADNIVGTPLFRVFPLSRFGVLT